MALDQKQHSPEASTPSEEETDFRAIALAEAHAAETAALAAAAKARVLELRRRRSSAHISSLTGDGNADNEDTHDVDGPAATAQRVAPADSAPASAEGDATRAALLQSLWMRRPKWTSVAASVAALSSVALLAATGYAQWHHRQLEADRHRSAEYAGAARQIVVTLMSIDSAKAKDDVRAILDNTTGPFKSEFENASGDFVKFAEQSKVATKTEVKAVAVESMTGDTAQVLVTAASTVTNVAGANQQPRSWRLSLDLKREGPQIKMSKLEFVP